MSSERSSSSFSSDEDDRSFTNGRREGENEITSLYSSSSPAGPGKIASINRDKAGRSGSGMEPLPLVKESTGRRRGKSTASNYSNANESLGLTLTRTVTKIVKAVQDDNEQTDRDKNDLDRVLKSRFDVGDAIRLEHNRNHSEPASTTAYSYNDEESALSWDGGSHLHKNKTEPLAQSDDSDHTTIKKVFTNRSTGGVELPPDGGYGWVVTFCVGLIMFSTWGCNSGFGVFLAFYLTENTYAGATKYDYALIAGMTVFFGQGLSPFVMSIMRIIGFKVTMLFGTALMLAGFILASFTTKLWQLYITQGFMIGASISFIFVPATTVLPGWFLKKRAVSMGLSLLGTGAGGVTYGLAVNKMIQEDGNPRWALRVLGISCTISCLVAIFLIKQRNPVPSVGLKSWKLIVLQFKQMFALRVLKNPFVPLIAIWCAFALFGYNLMIFTLSSYAIARGMTPHQGSVLTAVLNGAQCIGRPLMGLAGDRFGRANVTIVLTFLLTIFLFAFWIPAHNFVQLLFFSICIGGCVGVANVMNTVLIADFVQPDQFLPSWSFVNYFGAPFFLVCEVVAQALTVPKMKSNPYLHTQCFAGACFSCALILIIILREFAVRAKLTERQVLTNTKLNEYKLEADQMSDDEWEPLNERKIKYDLLLGPGIKKYFLRMIYPMKV